MFQINYIFSKKPLFFGTLLAYIIVMLKITREVTDNITILKLEGRVSEPWLTLLEKELAELAGDYRRQVILDFLGVTYISDEGVGLIKAFKDAGIGRRNCSLFIEYMFRNGAKRDVITSAKPPSKYCGGRREVSV